MKQLIINRLALRNFKGIAQAEATFSPGTTTISGHNGVGKSTFCDAFSWLFRGKNAAGDEVFGIKTVDAANNFIPHLDHTVEGDFTLVDTETGETEPISAKRSYCEEWKTDDGETAEKLAGHHTDYFWNNIPVKKSEYDAKVAALIPAAIFSTITDVYAFLTQHWELQRDQLTQLTGEVNPAEIAAKEPAYAALLQKMRDATLDQYKAMLGAQVKRIQDRLDVIPKLKDEAQRATPITPDYAALEARKAELEKTIADIDAAASNVAERRRLQYQKAAEIQQLINAQEKLQQEAIHAADMARSEANHAAQKQHNEATARIREIEGSIAQHDRGAQALSILLNDSKSAASSAIALDQELADFRKRYEAFYEQTYTPGSLICPRYGHECSDPTACTKGETEFNEAQVATLNRWREEGKAKAAEVERLKAQSDQLYKNYEEKTAQYNAEAARLQQELTDARAFLASLPPVNLLPEINPADLPAWQAAAQKIAELRQQYQTALAEPGDNAPTTAPDAKRQAQMELDEVKRKLGLRLIIEQQERRQRELDDEAAQLAQEKASVKKELATADAFSIAITNAVEERVNANFQLVKFKMFKTLVDGKKKPDCIPTVNGVSYKDVNTAGKINAGLDVIRTLTRFHQFMAPIFVDNCESVADLIEIPGAQVIRLQYVKNSPLTITPEQ